MKTIDLDSFSVPSFSSNLSSSQKFRKSQSREHDFLREFFCANFIPYVRNILETHPEYTYEDLEKHIKIDVTELSEAIFSASNAYHLYLNTIAHKYLVDYPDKLDIVLRDITSPEYNSCEKVAQSRYANTFRGTLMTYLLELLPAYNEEYKEYLADLPDGYHEYIEKEKEKGVSPKTILDNVIKKYKKEYFNYTFLNLSDFTAAARIDIFGLSEYLRTDKSMLEKFLRNSLSNSIVQLNTQFEKLGFTKRSLEIRRANLSKLGLDDFAQKLDENTYTTPDQISGATNSLSISNLLAYNTYLTNRYSKEADSLAGSLFVAYQYDTLKKLFDPEVQKFFRLKDAIDTHTETDLSEIYTIDKDALYPTKSDLFRMLKLLYSRNSYSNILSRMVSLPEARKDPSKVSLPGLIHEIKKIYPTREEFEAGISALTDFFPVPPEYKIALDKMSFLHNPTRLFMQEVQSQVNLAPDDFDFSLSPEEELEVFGNLSTNSNIIRYSYTPYQTFMTSAYGKEYKKHFDTLFAALPKYEHVGTEDLPKSDVFRDSFQYLRFYTPIFYSYAFKNDFINSLVAVIVNENEFKNAGIIVDSISPDGTTAEVGWHTGIGIDPNLTSGIQVHSSKKAILDFLEEFTGNSIIPIYEGMSDFEGISNQAVGPFSKPLVKYLKNLVNSPELSPRAQRYVSRINSLATGKIPEHLSEVTISTTGKKKKKVEFKRKYVDLKSGKIYELVNGVYTPVTPVSEEKTITDNNVSTNTDKKGEDYEL